MSFHATNTVTLLVLLAPWVLFLVWEVYVLVRRGSDVRVRTISMVAKEKGFHLSSVIYVWAGMASHWWWPSARPGPDWAAVLFWGLIVPLLVHDVVRWPVGHLFWPRRERVAFNPLLILVLGFVAGKVLFPQVG
jgi:hypothetical protein